MTARRTAAAAGISMLLAAAAAQAEVAREDILILGEDGRQFTQYSTLRSALPRRQSLLPGGMTPEDYLYIHPGDFRRQAVEGGTRLTFTGGNYALMRTGRFDDQQISRHDDGRITFRSWEGEKLDNGHYGKWNAPDPFADFAYVWVVPDNIEILEYRSNRDGDWRRSGNTLAWTGHDVNDLTFRITYRQTDSDNEAGQPAAAPPEREAGERITLDAAVLFPPGRHELTDDGAGRLDSLAERIRESDPERVIVSGHTDDQPLKAYLRETYPSNWELSAARATNVVRQLTDRGIDPGRLEARALGAQEPVADNDTESGRARNRRIEVSLIGVEADASAASQPADTDSGDAAEEEEEEQAETNAANTGETDAPRRAPEAFLR